MYPDNNSPSQVSIDGNKMQFKEIKEKKKYIRYFYTNSSDHIDFVQFSIKRLSFTK